MWGETMCVGVWHAGAVGHAGLQLRAYFGSSCYSRYCSSFCCRNHPARCLPPTSSLG